MLLDVVILTSALWASTAHRAVLVEPERVALDVQVADDESSAARIELVVRLDMPSSGWAVHVDDVAVDHEARRVAIRLTEIPPDGIAATVITRVDTRADLGPLEVGRWFVEIRSREGNAGVYGPLHAAILTAAP